VTFTDFGDAAPADFYFYQPLSLNVWTPADQGLFSACWNGTELEGIALDIFDLVAPGEQAGVNFVMTCGGDWTMNDFGGPSSGPYTIDAPSGVPGVPTLSSIGIAILGGLLGLAGYRRLRA
jgi:hypothetical protein